MFEIRRSLVTPHGSFPEGSTDSLKNVPKAIIDAWIKEGVVHRKQLTPLDEKKDKVAGQGT